jgi:hypothetical protein
MNDAANEGGIALAVKERVRDLEGQPLAPVMLPGFHVFSTGGSTPPYTWLVPKPVGNYEDLLNYWEAYVGEVSGSRKAPLDPLRSISQDRTVLNSVAFNRFFGDPRRQSEWATPAAKIIAIAQHLKGQGQEGLDARILPNRVYERQRIESISMFMSQFYLEVTPTHLFTNYGAKLLKPGYSAGDATLDELCIRPLRSNHPLAIALMEREDTPEAALQAAAVVLRAHALGRLSEADIRLRTGSAGVTPEQAVIKAYEALAAGSQSLRDVYDVLVPAVMTSREFRSRFGNGFRQTKTTRPETIDRWREALYELAP